ncbi:hypothetical protein [Lactobacillus sp. ESL0681]|uniref:hypothetical protein n=1 Tax=Lactobacillus sp. ESL0681 TaxID=2983211 RepID=UPI0023F739C8|nr:hypothetical protein [Lactobacillus sp. ESL0681]WEV39607.1 hypothetical protein OZX59_05160 [Lactobacillus sp. ESL0681]
MKPESFIKKCVSIVALISCIALFPQTSHAATYKIIKQSSNHPHGRYRTKNPKVSAPIWNKKHTKKLNNLKSQESKNWYVSDSVKFKHGNKKSTFYKISNDDNTISGYVWRGYLTEGAMVPKQFCLSGDTVPIPEKCVDEKVNQKITQLFSEVIPDKQAQLAANLQATRAQLHVGSPEDIAKEEELTELGEDNLKLITKINVEKPYTGTSDNLLTFEKEQISKELQKQGKTLNSFKGYRIGAYVFPKIKDKFTGVTGDFYGKAVIYLIPPEVQLPRQNTMFYDPIDSNWGTGDAINSTKIDKNLNNKLISLFPKTNRNLQVQVAADLSYPDTIPDPDDSEGPDYHNKTLKDLLGKKGYKSAIVLDTYINSGDYNDEEIYSITKNKLKVALKKKHKKFADFKGYRIGAYICPIHDDHVDKYGETEVILVPPKVRLPNVGNLTFGLDDVKLN